MSDATLRIKNLSIALEALSRISGSHELYWDIEKLLKIEIKDLQEENEKENQWPQRPARTATNNLEADDF